MQNQEKVFKKLDELLAKFKNAKEWTDLVKYITEMIISMNMALRHLRIGIILNL